MKRILLAVVAAGGDTMNRLARSLSLTACALLFSIAGANAITLTAEQQELVKKYNISPADQKKLFATQPVAARPARSERSATANAAPPERQTPPRAYAPENRTPTGGFLANTYVWVGADSYKSIGERITNINGGTGALTSSFGAVGGFNSGFGFGDSPIRFQAGA